MTFNPIVYMFSTCKWYFNIILTAGQREFSSLTEMHELSRKGIDLLVLRYGFPCTQGSPPWYNLRFARDLKVICPHLKLLHAYGLFP